MANTIRLTRNAADSMLGLFIAITRAKEPPESHWRFPVPTKKLILRTYLTPEEHELIRASANKAGLSLSTFSKRVCLGFFVPSLEHQEARIELRRLKGDLGRLGGLVKQALANGADRQTIHRLLHELDARQRELQQAIAVIK